MFCNVMGLPGFTSDLAQYPQKRIRKSIGYIEAPLSLTGFTAISIAYLLGITGYIYTLGAWTTGFSSLYWT